MAERKDNWGALMEILREMGPAGSLVAGKPMPPEGGRAFVRWLFSSLEAFTFCLKRITDEHVGAHGTPVSQRERDVLSMVKEPAFPGQPPPRRVETGMRESFGVALSVYARARGKQSPLYEGRLPVVFIEASSLHDRIAHPESPDDLRLSKTDLTTIVEFCRWFETIRIWLYNDRAEEIEEVRTKLNASAEFIRRQLMGTDNQGSFSSTEEQVSFKTSPSLLQVVGREVNRRDAKLVCHLCETRTELHFYEGDGEPKLDGPLLWTVHYGKCSGVKDEQPIGLRLMWNDGRETENLVLNPSTRKLIPLGS